MYKKALVQEVPYTEKTFSHYQNHLTVSKKIASTHKISSKEELQQALLGKSLPEVREASSVVYHDASKVAFKSEPQVASKYRDKLERDIAADLSKKLASGVEAESFKQYVTERYSASYKTYPEVFKKYSAYVGSLGRVFVELEPFATALEAKNFIQRHASKVPYVLADGRKSFVEPDGTFLGKTVISSLSEIPLDVWVTNLRGKAFNAHDLSANPLAVTKAAFFAPKVKTASSAPAETYEVGTVDLIEQTLTAPTYNKKATAAPQTKTAAKLKPNKESNVKADGNKVRAVVDKNLEIEIEPSNYDETISKYT